MRKQRYAIVPIDMQTTADSSLETDGAVDMCVLNNEIKSRSANLRGAPYEGMIHIEWAQNDCEMAPTITVGFMYGADGGDREGFLKRVLLARFTIAGEELRLIFGECAEPLCPYSIQLAGAEQGSAPCVIKVRAQGQGATRPVLLTVSCTNWHGLDLWILCVMEVFGRYRASVAPPLFSSAPC